jgi:NAD(P)-dependent dehydrogenase (short-subunit alcohol dehydrogenase family)
MKRILITGCSTGFGLETARLFLARDWNVVATMRNLRADILPPSDRLQVLQLDVTDEQSVAKAIALAGPIDALVNNAGVGMLNAFEGIPLGDARALFETNLFGAMATIQAVLPQFRERKTGVIVNVSSTVTMKPLNLLQVYTASKAAMNALTECLALELAPFNIRTRIVLPGQAPETAFGQNARALMREIPQPYAEVAQQIFTAFEQHRPEKITRASDVAEAVWRAVTDPASPMKIPAGADAEALAAESGF